MSSKDITTVLITGCSSGFGKITAEILASAGYHVFATMRGVEAKNAENAGNLTAWAEAQAVPLDVLELDVTDDASVDRAVSKILDRAGYIDVVINNAGIGANGLIECYTVDQARSIFEVNTLGPIRVNRAVLPTMRERRSGLLIYLTSAAGRLYLPALGIYSATKYALEALSESYAEELRPLGIDSVSVEPGAFPTDVGVNSVEPADIGRMDGYGEVANLPAKVNAAFGRMFSGPNLPDPAEVANAIREIIEMPQGERPIRIVVGDLATLGIEELNRTTLEFQAAYTQSFISLFD